MLAFVAVSGKNCSQFVTAKVDGTSVDPTLLEKQVFL